MTVTNFIWDEHYCIAETDGTNVVQVVYTNEPAQYGNLISTRVGSTTSWHHFDALGSTRQLTNAVQAVTDTWVYDAWGYVVFRSGITVALLRRIGELGYVYDIETALLSVRQRVYGPTIARWTSVAPALFIDSVILFQYVPNSPIGRFDPTGRQACGGGEETNLTLRVNCRRLFSEVDIDLGKIPKHCYILLGDEPNATTDMMTTYSMTPAGTGKIRFYVNHKSERDNDGRPHIEDDGRYLAYISPEAEMKEMQACLEDFVKNNQKGDTVYNCDNCNSNWSAMQMLRFCLAKDWSWKNNSGQQAIPFAGATCNRETKIVYKNCRTGYGK
jgi:RHS repeat-associated protein